MNSDLLCMGCMMNTSGANICPSCGYARRATAESAAQLPPRTVLRNRYLLGRVLGQGGFGITYLAFDLEENCKLAIKEYFPAYISTRASDRLSVTPLASRHREDMEYGLKRFHEEGQALFRFRDHPNVVRMVEFFYANGTGYIVMVYIEGCTFKQHLKNKGGKEPFAEALSSLNKVMNALRDLHSVHCFHRDISPDNIYLEDGGGVRLLDFGATRYAMGEQSRSLSVILKPGYAPEEQYRSKGHQGAWTDIYALGATMYQAITAQAPPDAMDRLQHDTLIPPRQLGAGISTRAEGALLKALAVKAENRFQSISEFRAALDPPPAITPAVPIPSSRKLFFSAFVMLLVLLLVFGSTPALLGWLALTLLLFLSLLLVLFSRMWKAIQDGYASTTPDKAVWFMFIPFFNIYWIFRVLWGFAKDYNKFIERHSIAVKKLNEPLFLACTISLIAYCVFVLANFLFATTVLLVIHAALLLPVVVRVCDGIDALLGYGPRQPPIRPQGPGTAPAMITHGLSLHCLGGEYKGQEIDVHGELVIGRNPALANLVLASREVSAKHLRVWRDGADSGAWIEDLGSTNGTFYRQDHSPESQWVRLSGGKLLSSGDHFRLSNDAAEFRVKIT